MTLGKEHLQRPSLEETPGWASSSTQPQLVLAAMAVQLSPVNLA